MSNFNNLRYLALISQLGLTMIFTILVGFGIGFFLDKHFLTSPIWTLVFLVFGIAGGFIGVYKMIMRELEKK